MAEQLPAVLIVEDLGDGRYAAPHPTDDPEGRDVVFSGQILAQMIMASDHAVESAKDVKSIHAIFARAGAYSAGPMELRLEAMHSGHAWGSDTITATQGDRLLSRGLVLLSTVEPDLIRHSPTMPDVPDPDELEPEPTLVFPGVETRTVDDPKATSPDGTPMLSFWMRNGESYDSVAANQAILSWCQPGLIIGLAMRPHDDVVKIEDSAPDGVDRCDLAHVPFPRALRRGEVAARRAAGHLRRSGAGVRFGRGLHAGRHPRVDVRAGQHGSWRRGHPRPQPLDVDGHDRADRADRTAR